MYNGLKQDETICANGNNLPSSLHTFPSVFYVAYHISENTIQLYYHAEEYTNLNQKNKQLATPIVKSINTFHKDRIELYLFLLKSYYKSINDSDSKQRMRINLMFYVEVPMKVDRDNYHWISQYHILESSNQIKDIYQIRNTVGRKYKGELISEPYFIDYNKNHLVTIINNKISKLINNEICAIFNPIHLRIINLYLKNMNAEVRSISLVIGLNQMTIKNHQRRILRLANQYFNYSFDNCKLFTYYLQTIGITEVI